MEILDRNSLLQQLFSARASNSPVLSSEDAGFADMLKSPEKEVPDNINFREAKAEKIAVKNEKEQEFPVKDSAKVKKEDCKDNDSAKENKNVAKSECDKKECKTDDNIVREADEEKSVAAVAGQVAEPQEVVVETENVEILDEQIPELVISDEIEILVDEIVAEKNVVPMISTQNAVENVVAAEEVVVMPEISSIVSEDIKFEQTKISDDAPVADNEIVLSEEDALILEQAKYLDKKISGDVKLKIDVAVKEEKIAEPIIKDVLQNRFEVDSLFQNIEAEVVVDDVENIVLAENADSTPQKTSDVPMLHLKGLTLAENQVSSFDAAKTVVENATVSVSGKEVVFESANATKNEAFSRINETSSRDVFKGMGKEVIEQVKVNITKSAVKGVDTIDIQLKPEDLGKIQIKMHIGKDGKLQAEIISARAETLELLQKDVSGLAKAFNDAGYDTDSRSFNFSFQDENQTREQQKDDSGLLQFIGDTLEQEANNIAGNDNLGYDPLLGLNIRV